MVKYAGGALLPTLQFDRTSRTAISVQLACALRELILDGQLQPGQRLPSSRTLADDQGVSRTTAISVYEQLTSEGLIRSTVGAGAFISDELAVARPAAKSGNAPSIDRPPPRLAQLCEDASDHYFPRLSHPEQPQAFITGIPAFDEFPMALWASLAARYWRQPRNLIMGYPDAEGLMALRRAVATHLKANRGIDCAPDQVFIFNGAQDAFNRIGNTLLDPGDAVWLENPGAIGARNSLISCGAKLIPLPIDDEGMSVEAGLAIAPDFRLAFVTPAHQHPLGVTMSLRRRFELLRAAERAGAWIIEDDYVGEFHNSSHPPPTLKSVDTSGRVIYVGSFSKVLFAALRLGYVVAPPDLVDVFHRVAGATMQGAPTSLQSIVASFIEGGHFAGHIRRMRHIYTERRQALAEAVKSQLDGALEVLPSETGFHSFARLAPEFDENAVSAEAAKRGITASPVSRFSIAPVEQRGLILGYSAIPPREIATGVETLAKMLGEIRSRGG